MDNVDITIGGLRLRAFNARRTLCEFPKTSESQAEANLYFVQTMAIIQIAQELNEIKTFLRRKDSEHNSRS